MTIDVVCLDFEASGLAPASYPIEVAIVDVVTCKVQSWLIRPTDVWLQRGGWMPEAEVIHGLSLQRLITEGVPVEAVAQQLTSALRGRRVLSDRKESDSKWLRDLYAAIGLPTPPFLLEDFYAFAKQVASLVNCHADTAFAKAEAEAWLKFPIPHRAEPDAKRNAEILRILKGD